MKNEFLDKVKDNAFVQRWSENAQLGKGDSLAKKHTVVQNDLQELKELWSPWDDQMKQLLYCNYGDIPYLLDVKVDRYLFCVMAQFWNSTYSCFTFGKVDLAPTVEEYTALLRCLRFQVDKIYSRAVNTPTFVKRLMNITGMSEQWVTARVQ
ncbi:hypothetical protein CXB51_004497 [Gossypium anomalum]|uniref:DUF7745 domain-containing protein n=1 Tax=Gossypium anomalum TaxID=47600 RepID=A0A8J5ZNT9_9ROSI|nr:hypothetical protein CXB51_004497 [Gossypium anomalum]